MQKVLGLFNSVLKKKEPPSKEEENNAKLFRQFRSSIPCQKATVGIANAKVWRFYDQGDLTKAPIICLPPSGGSADVFYKLLLTLPEKGIRLIAVQHPAIIDHDEWIESFSQFLNHLKLKRVHLLGCGVGGFLSLLFTRIHQQRVISTILINSYSSNIALVEPTAKYELAPAFVLKKIIQEPFQEKGSMENMASVKFFKDHMDDLSSGELFSCIVLEKAEAFIDKRKIDTSVLTIIESDDFSSLPLTVKASLSQTFTTARIVPLKKGGDFPFISQADEIALHITVHMRRLDPSLLPAEVLKQIPSSEHSNEKVGAVPDKEDDDPAVAARAMPVTAPNAAVAAAAAAAAEEATATSTSSPSSSSSSSSSESSEADPQAAPEPASESSSSSNSTSPDENAEETEQGTVVHYNNNNNAEENENAPLF